MLFFFICVAVAILLFTHYSAYAFGVRRTERIVWRWGMRPLVERQRKLYRETLKAALEPNALAQQRNVKLEILNYRLRRKAIIYALKYRAAARRLRYPGSRLEFLTRTVSALADVHARTDIK